MPAEAAQSEWQVSLDDFAINHLAMNLVDRSVQPFADVGISDFNLQISNRKGPIYPVETTARPLHSFTIN